MQMQMVKRRSSLAWAVLGLGVVLLVTGCAGLESQEDMAPKLYLFGQTTDTWRDLILPDREDLAFEEIPWLPTFAEGIEKANAERVPAEKVSVEKVPGERAGEKARASAPRAAVKLARLTPPSSASPSTPIRLRTLPNDSRSRAISACS